MTEATPTESTMIIHDFVNPPPEEEPITCPICGLSWETEDLSDACCIPGVLAYAAGRSDGWTTRQVPERVCGNVAYIEDLPEILAHVRDYIIHNEITYRDGPYFGEHKAAHMIGVKPETWKGIEAGNVVWISEYAYDRLKDALGDPVPGLVYWPAELSCPVGRDEYA